MKHEKLKRVSKVCRVFLTEKDQLVDNGVMSLSDLRDCYWIFLFVYFVLFPYLHKIKVLSYGSYLPTQEDSQSSVSSHPE